MCVCVCVCVCVCLSSAKCAFVSNDVVAVVLFLLLLLLLLLLCPYFPFQNMPANKEVRGRELRLVCDWVCCTFCRPDTFCRPNLIPPEHNNPRQQGAKPNRSTDKLACKMTYHRYDVNRDQLYIPPAPCSPSSICLQLYVPLALYSSSSIFPQLYVPPALYSPSSMFPQFYVLPWSSSFVPHPKEEGTLFWGSVCPSQFCLRLALI